MKLLQNRYRNLYFQYFRKDSNLVAIVTIIACIQCSSPNFQKKSM